MTSADASRPERLLPWRVAAWAWLAFCLVVAVHQFSFWRSTHFDTDVMALLPQDEQAPEVGIATRQMADQVTRQVVVMIGAADWASAQKAADAWERPRWPGRTRCATRSPSTHRTATAC
jgi:predicted exporter